MVHVSDISAEKRINQPQDVLRVGQVVKAQVLAIDLEKRQMRLGMKQLVPTGLDEYIAEHNEGDVVTGRLMDDSGGQARVELGEGIHAILQDDRSHSGEKARSRLRRESKAGYFFLEFHAAGALEERLRRTSQGRSRADGAGSEFSNRESGPGGEED